MAIPVAAIAEKCAETAAKAAEVAEKAAETAEKALKNPADKAFDPTARIEVGNLDKVSVTESFNPGKRLEIPETGRETGTIEKYDPRKRIESPDADKYRNCPESNGHWTGERGESKWVPDDDYAPQKFNESGETWKEIKEEYKIDGINFKGGEPDFSPVSVETVQIEGFSADRMSNFDLADKMAAGQRGMSPSEFRSWRKENVMTWHECPDMQTMQLVPNKIHGNVPHTGGIAKAKELEMLNSFTGSGGL